MESFVDKLPKAELHLHQAAKQALIDEIDEVASRPWPDPVPGPEDAAGDVFAAVSGDVSAVTARA
jgi:hypothetical protein